MGNKRRYQKEAENLQNSKTEDSSQDDSREVKRFASGMFRAWITVTVLIILFCAAGAFLTVHVIKRGRSSTKESGAYKKAEYTAPDSSHEKTDRFGTGEQDLVTDVSELTGDFLDGVRSAVIKKIDSDDSGNRDAGKAPVYLGAYILYSADQNDNRMILVYSQEYKPEGSDKTQNIYRAFIFSPVTLDGSGNPKCDTEPMEYMNRVITGTKGEYVTGFETLKDLYSRAVQRESDYTCSATDGLPVE